MQNKDLEARLADMDVIAAKSGKTMFTGFVSPAEQASLAHLKSKLKCRLFFTAGYDGAERMLAAVSPDEGGGVPPIEYLKITVKSGEKLTHRDVMGAVLALGIKRDALGDIIACENGFVIAVSEKVAPYILQELTKIGREGVVTERCDSAPTPPEPVFEEIIATVASLRLDSTVSEGFGISRTLASEQIRKGAVFVNWEEETSPSKEVKEGDKISLRGKGKVLLAQVGGQSKKGRTFIKLHRYL